MLAGVRLRVIIPCGAVLSLCAIYLRRRRRRRSLTGCELPRVATEVPGPRSRALIDKLACYECPAITARRARRADALGAAAADPIVWQAARGSVVLDVDNNVFVDITSGFGVATLGHGASTVCEAGVAQLQKPLIHAMGDAFPDSSRIELLQELASLLPGLPKGILGCSGADAVQAALKTAALKTGKSGVLAFSGSYHGLAHGALAPSMYKADDFREPFINQLGAHVTFARFAISPLPSLAGIGAVIVEPLQGRGGVRAAPVEWLIALRAHCDSEGALLIYDEIYTGFGRTGSWFAYQSAGQGIGGEHGTGAPEPDLICLGKAMGGGFPISVCLGTADAMNAWGASKGEALHTQTFLGNPLGCSMALAALRELRRLDAPRVARQKGQKLKSLLAAKGLTNVRGRGLMLACEVPDPLYVMASTLRSGIIALPCGEGPHFNAIAIIPPVTITEEQMRAAVHAIAQACKQGSKGSERLIAKCPAYQQWGWTTQQSPLS